MSKSNLRGGPFLSKPNPENYFFLVYIGYFLFVLFPSLVRPGVVAALLMSFFWVRLFPYRFRGLDYIVLCYLLISIFGVFRTFYGGLPIGVGLAEFANSSMPLVFYFIGRQRAADKAVFFSGYVVASMFCFAVGAFWYITLPAYYVEFLRTVGAATSLASYLMDMRFSSFIGSIGMGMIASATVAIAGHNFAKKRSTLGLVSFISAVVVSFLTLQRASFIMTFLVLTSLLVVHRKKLNFYWITAVVAGLTLLFLYLLTQPEFNLLTNVLGRFSKFDSAFSERGAQFETFNELGLDVLTGRGLGAMSHKALEFSSDLINDNAYLKLIAELGVLGFVVFSIIVLTTTWRLLRRRNGDSRYIEGTIFVLFLVQSLGSNSFFYQELAPIFWLSIGLINSNRTNA